ncbi:hypothetical protein SBI67_27725 [Mycolicibacterium sp. 120266]|uniref:hypothetical protein n=1 Tax=Mycolicibacterium sp. 120266 TaxID=3090601 RepID=UPI00299EEE33|nr:hypothetical protein [Mycolicibacterium sp. 120266]MDX1875924.1 hypothetical protein [Mycolicibacterium sp. 120266]
MTSATTCLAEAAFGPRPDLWPLPAPTSQRDRWLRAVAAGGQGRYASALTDLAHLAAHTAPGPGGEPLLSLSYSTRASFLRQLGGHDLARGWDGRAWAAAGQDREAGADALIGLAADALGVGRFALSATLLQRAERLIDGSGPARLPVRLHWVSAELNMAGGAGAVAVGHAERATELAESTGSPRHAVKSAVVLAAALCSAGRLPDARRIADEAFGDTERLGLVPLRWALACLLADIGSTVHPPAHVAAVRDAAADTVRRRGGVWTRR